MQWIAGRPLGVTLIAVLLALNGIAALVEVYALAVSATGDWIAMALEGLLGVTLLFKAYGIWTFHLVGWLATLITLAAHMFIVGAEITQGHAELSSWYALITAVVAIRYLLDPRVRSLFTSGEANQR